MLSSLVSGGATARLERAIRSSQCLKRPIVHLRGSLSVTTGSSWLFQCGRGSQLGYRQMLAGNRGLKNGPSSPQSRPVKPTTPVKYKQKLAGNRDTKTGPLSPHAQPVKPTPVKSTPVNYKQNLPGPSSPQSKPVQPTPVKSTPAKSTEASSQNYHQPNQPNHPAHIARVGDILQSGPPQTRERIKELSKGMNRTTKPKLDRQTKMKDKQEAKGQPQSEVELAGNKHFAAASNGYFDSILRENKRVVSPSKGKVSPQRALEIKRVVKALVDMKYDVRLKGQIVKTLPKPDRSIALAVTKRKLRTNRKIEIIERKIEEMEREIEKKREGSTADTCNVQLTRQDEPLQGPLSKQKQDTRADFTGPLFVAPPVTQSQSAPWSRRFTQYLNSSRQAPQVQTADLRISTTSFPPVAGQGHGPRSATSAQNARLWTAEIDDSRESVRILPGTQDKEPGPVAKDTKTLPDVEVDDADAPPTKAVSAPPAVPTATSQKNTRKKKKENQRVRYARRKVGQVQTKNPKFRFV